MHILQYCYNNLRKHVENKHLRKAMAILVDKNIQTSIAFFQVKLGSERNKTCNCDNFGGNF